MKVKSLTESLERLIENKYVEKEPSNILEAIDNILGKLNEAEMSPEDARDTELLKSARHKIAGKKTNVKNLTPEEQEVLAKYGLDAWGYKGETKMVTPGHKDIFRGQEARGWGRSSSDRFSEPKDSWNGRSARSYQGGDYNKANFADRARKIDSRIENQPYRDLEAARHTDEMSMRDKYGVNRIASVARQAQYHADALNNLEAEEAELKKRADDKYEKTHKDIERSLEWQYNSRDKAQDKIDQILNKHRKEVVESLQHFLRTLNEANMSDEDRRDSDVIKDITYKLMKRRNAKLTDEEKAILDKYNLIQTGNRLKTSNHTIMPKPDDQLTHKSGNELETNVYDNNDDKFAKMNLADFARKADSRGAKRRSVSKNDWSDDYRATNHDKANFEHSYDRGSTQRQRRIQQTADMTRDYDDMSKALEDRKYANAAIDHKRKELNDASYARHAAKKQAEERTVQQRKFHTDKAAEYNAEKDRMIAAKKAQFSKKDESLNESSNHYYVSVYDVDENKYPLLEEALNCGGISLIVYDDTHMYNEQLDVELLEDEGINVNALIKEVKKFAKDIGVNFILDLDRFDESLNEGDQRHYVPGDEIDLIDVYQTQNASFKRHGKKLKDTDGKINDFSAKKRNDILDDQAHNSYWSSINRKSGKYSHKNPKNDPLNEAAGDVRIVKTGLSGDFGKEIIDSIIGQMSDGIWENTPYMEYYWPNVDATANGDIEVSTDWTSNWSHKENKFRSMSDQEVRKFFANKLKAIVQEYLNDNNMNPYTEFRADNEEVCSYLGGHVVEDITVGQAYEAYNILRK